VIARRPGPYHQQEEAMKKKIRRKAGLAAAGSWLIPIAFTAAAVVFIARFDGDTSAYAAYTPPVLLQTSTMPWSQPASRSEDGAQERTQRGHAF
jgi:hypothetical protein